MNKNEQPQVNPRARSTGTARLHAQRLPDWRGCVPGAPDLQRIETDNGTRSVQTARI
jgi:hypothetical protein